MTGNILTKIFRWMSDTINGGERAILDALSAVVPYTTASIPAYLTYWHVIEYMEFPTQIAWLAAFTVEVLGVTAVSTAIRFWRWNVNHKSTNERAPFFLAVFTYAFYIVITLSVNVLLEVYAAVRTPAVIWSIGLFSLLSIPSGVLISIRAQFGEMLEDKLEKAQARKMANNPQPAFQQTTPQLRSRHASDYRDKILAYLDANYKDDNHPKLPDISAKFGLDHSKAKGYISTLRTEWKRSKNKV